MGANSVTFLHLLRFFQLYIELNLNFPTRRKRGQNWIGCIYMKINRFNCNDMWVSKHWTLNWSPIVSCVYPLLSMFASLSLSLFFCFSFVSFLRLVPVRKITCWLCFSFSLEHNSNLTWLSVILLFPYFIHCMIIMSMSVSLYLSLSLSFTDSCPVMFSLYSILIFVRSFVPSA